MTAPAGSTKLLLEQLTGRMSMPGRPIRHGFGTQDDAAHMSADRIVWIPAGLDPAPIGYHVDDGETVGEQQRRLDVSIYAGDFDAVCQLHADLWAWLDILAGPKEGCPAIGDNPARGGYEIGASKVEPRGGDLAATGWGTVVAVTLKSPVVRRFFPSGTVVETSVETFATALDTTEPEPGIGTEDP